MRRFLNLLVLGLLPLAAFHAAEVPATPGPPVPPDHAERFARGLQTFTNHVRAVLIEQCLKCHGGEKTKGGFDLSTREDLLRGGDDGPAVVPFNAKTSVLVALVNHTREPHMPSKAPPLSSAAIARIVEWIDDGAPYEGSLVNAASNAVASSTTASAPRWWAFEPLHRAEPPPVRNEAWVRTPIDRFILSPLEQKNLTPAGAAGGTVLLRRLHLDVLGLPPTPEEVDAFVNDSSADAWSRVVDELLARPEHGERWARYWLDVARFAESSGFEHDYDRPSAYHYRDFVIRALNDDLPFDQFVRWQLAGDEFEPENPLALMATGFLGAGVFPTQITANEVERTRYDAMDDMLATTGTAMLGLTVGCARCHDHKFDPIPTREYYRLLSTFTTTVRSELELDLDPEAYPREKKSHDSSHAPLVAAVCAYEERELPGKFEAWIASGAPVETRPTWKVLELGALKSDAGATFRRLEDGSYRVEGTNAAFDRYTLGGEFRGQPLTALRLEALADDGLVKRGPGRADNGNIGLSRIRVLASSLAGGSTQEVALTHPRATFQQNSNNLAIASVLDNQPQTGWAVDPRFGTNHAAAFDFATPIDDPAGTRLTVVLEFNVNTRHNIGRPRLSVSAIPDPPLDGESLPAALAVALSKLTNSTGPAATASLTASERTTVLDWWKTTDPGWRGLNDAVVAHAKTEPRRKLTKVLTCTEGNTPVRMHTQGADFFPETYQLRRGSTDQKLEIAKQGFLQVLTRASDADRQWAWTPPAGAKFSGRRRALANWITDTETGAGHLLARVIVNRLWQHHFGRGLVETPNDFGVQGSRPTHPELLDWLASELIRQGWRLRPIHQLILNSAAYREASQDRRDGPRSAASDYQYFQPRRLEAEAIRDSVLFVCGVLDNRRHGPGTLDESSTRRSIYFTVKRSQMVPAMQLFDAPEPLVSQGTRPATTVAPQALLLMNSPHVRGWAASFARRIAPDPDALLPTAVQSAYRIALGRPPTAAESSASVAFIERQARDYTSDGKTSARDLAMTDFAQAILSLNEFVYVE